MFVSPEGGGTFTNTSLCPSAEGGAAFCLFLCKSFDDEIKQNKKNISSVFLFFYFFHVFV